jgi:hypothetical protein
MYAEYSVDGPGLKRGLVDERWASDDDELQALGPCEFVDGSQEDATRAVRQFPMVVSRFDSVTVGDCDSGGCDRHITSAT